MKQKRTIGTQTLFRESEAQTDPSAFGNIERDGTFLEILELNDFKFGKGLPASVYELELISKMREKRAFNDALPPLSDESCFNLRRIITQEQEVREWNFFENDLKEANNKRLMKLQQLLEQKEKDSEETRIRKIEEMKSLKEEEVESFIIKTRKLRVKIIRLTGKQKENFNKKEKFKRDIIMEYASFGSKVYAPLTREGSNPDRYPFKFEMNEEYTEEFRGLNIIEQELYSKNKLNKRDNSIDSGFSTDTSSSSFTQMQFNKGEKMHIKALDDAFNSIEKGEKKKEDEIKRQIEKKIQDDKNKELKKEKVETKQVDVSIVEEIILLQRLLKGRKEQNLMYQGKFKRTELIKELRAANHYKNEVATGEETQVVENYIDKLTNGVIDSVQGHIISKNLDYLSKELVRINQEKMVNAVISKAEEIRRKREADEMGKRQSENLMRKRQDIMYKDILETNQSTVDSYVNALLAGNVNKVSKKQVMKEIEIKANKLNTIVDKIEGAFIKDDIAVKDLVSSFIIPEIDRKKREDRVELEENRFIETAKNSIHLSMKTAKNKLYVINEDKED